jgi:hypothetical protein
MARLKTEDPKIFDFCCWVPILASKKFVNLWLFRETNSLRLFLKQFSSKPENNYIHRKNRAPWVFYVGCLHVFWIFGSREIFFGMIFA